MKKSLLALFAAAALTSGLAMAADPSPSNDVDAPAQQSPVTNVKESGATFQWSGLVPEANTTQAGGIIIKPAPGSRDFLDGTLTFFNDKGNISLRDSDTLSFEVFQQKSNGDGTFAPDELTEVDSFDYSLEYVKVGVNGAPQDYNGLFFDIVADEKILEVEAAVAVKHDTKEPVRVRVASPLANTKEETDSNAVKEIQALDTVVVQASILVTSPSEL